jgi:hypothetical protein
MVRVDGSKEYSKSSLWITWMSAFFAVVIGANVVGMVAGQIQRSRAGAAGQVRGVPGRRARTGGIIKRGFLTAHQVRELFSTFDSILREKDEETNEWTCSICLEENEPGQDVRTVLLPCSHRFHRQYVFSANPLCYFSKGAYHTFLE